jgi:hypothetical protein
LKAGHGLLLLEVTKRRKFRVIECIFGANHENPFSFFIGSVGNDRKFMSFCSLDIGTMFKFCAL